MFFAHGGYDIISLEILMKKGVAKMFKDGFEDEFFDDEEHIINIAASSKFKHQDEHYNEAYKSWRSNPENKYTYNYVADKREHAYINGRGFLAQSPAVAERLALIKNMNIIGLALLAAIAIEIFGPALLVRITSLFGVSARYDVFGGTNASDGYILFADFFIKALSRLVPFFMIMRAMKMPRMVALPTTVTNKDMHWLGIHLVFINVPVSVFCLGIYEKTLTLFKINMWDEFFMLPENIFLRIAAFVLQAIFIPALNEILFRGAIMQPLRQFGDSFAILASSIISALMAKSIALFFFNLVVAFVVSYFVLRTGSVKTGIIMQIAFYMAVYGIYCIKVYLPNEIDEYVLTWLNLAMVLIGIIIIIVYMNFKRNLLTLQMQKTYIPTAEKLVYSISSVPLAIWMLCIFVCSLMSINFLD